MFVTFFLAVSLAVIVAVCVVVSSDVASFARAVGVLSVFGVLESVGIAAVCCHSWWWWYIFYFLCIFVSKCKDKETIPDIAPILSIPA